jgi:hypothetical protein
MWSVLDFGKHKGRTLPWVSLHDPDWFFWAMENDVFGNRPNLLPEATRLSFCSRRVKIPKPDPENWQVRYEVTLDHKFLRFSIVPKGA